MKPVLIIMAAGMGSRFGGPKQITPVDDGGHVILDYSAFDAMRAGFGRVICVIKKETEADFRAAVGDRLAAHLPLEYAYQALDDLPEGVTVPAGRAKPWGTAHAVRSCRHLLKDDEPFAVINADDFYGAGCFRALADFLSVPGNPHEQCLVTYKLRNCLSENGSVARGVCAVDENHHLRTITELLKIQGPAEAPFNTEPDGSLRPLSADTPVSLNAWGFRPGTMRAFEAEFERFLREEMPQNPEKGECYLPTVVNNCLKAGTDVVTVIPTDECWHGVTYREDLPEVRSAVAALTAAGVYPDGLWD